VTASSSCRLEHSNGIWRPKPAIGDALRTQLSARQPIDFFSEDVSVSSAARRLLHHVDEHPTEREGFSCCEAAHAKGFDIVVLVQDGVASGDSVPIAGNNGIDCVV
jgi:hypothetical protein